jgi:hypothetical protein
LVKQEAKRVKKHVEKIMEKKEKAEQSRDFINRKKFENVDAQKLPNLYFV